jgi:peptide chain release factor 1
MILIQDKDIKRETCRSSGAGGQHVNTTDSAVKLTHIPTGIVATSQAGRSQHENERQARLVLESRILAKSQTEKEGKERDLRLSMIGTAARSESIRTYNWPQNRVTDDRLRRS